MLQRTPLYPLHVEAGARMVDFGGWEMPLHYGSQIEEHHAVRRHAGLFDVSHMRAVDIDGAGAAAFLGALVTADIARRPPGRAMYGCMLNERGTIIDDLIVYRCADAPLPFRAVLNAATAPGDLQWMQHVAATQRCQVSCRPRADLAILALQGPHAVPVLQAARPAWGAAASPLAAFGCIWIGDVFIGRTGYTGEDGFELVVPANAAAALWRDLVQAGAAPCGLGARDTLRLEAGMALYGQDLDDSVTPLESGLAWTVEWEGDRRFIGREALQRQQADGLQRHLLGLKLLGKGVLRAHQTVQTPYGEGQVTSGTFSPTLQVSIGLARLPIAVRVGDTVQAQLRGTPCPAQVVKARFVRHGKPLD